ncbi:hypothetical protein [Streptosporangium sp. NPDC020145]|uniref:hypothetical protein n=1 Tax=Streptosporangium sp. NPDC020145 TaxID=3154694 RepID=UPI003435406F
MALVARRAIGAGAGQAGAAVHPEGGHDRVEGGAVRDVAAGQVRGEWYASGFGDQVDFGVSSPHRTTNDRLAVSAMIIYWTFA